MQKRNRKIALAGLLLCGMLLAGGHTAYAITGIVNSDAVYVRSEPSTSAGVVGYASKDYRFTVGEAKQDADGMTWYQITLEDGTEGYIRSDFVNVTTDDVGSEIAAVETSNAASSTESAAQEETPSAPESTDAAAASGYTIEKQSDGTWALVSADTGEKIAIGDLQEMKDQLAKNNAEIESAASRGRTWAILLAVVIAAVLFLDTILYRALHRVTGFTLSVYLRRIQRSIRRYQKKRAGIAMENQLDLMEQAGRTPDEKPFLEISVLTLKGPGKKKKRRKPGAPQKRRPQSAGRSKAETEMQTPGEPAEEAGTEEQNTHRKEERIEKKGQ